MTAVETRRKALVVGLGISGITTALRLHQIGWEPVIVERAPSRRTGGYFVGIFGAGRAAAERMGMLDHLHDRRSGGVVFDTDRAGNRRVGMSFADLPGVPWMALRGDIEAAAYRALPNDIEIRYSTVPSLIEQGRDSVAVTLTTTTTAITTTERFDLVVGADGLRSSVRSLVFGPHQRYLKQLNHMIAAFELPATIRGLDPLDGVSLIEVGRSMSVYPFVDHAPTALFSYRTSDVEAEFATSPAKRLREVYGPQPLGRLLGQVIDAFECAEDYLFDSVESVHLDRWHQGRVVLIGDAAWCETLYSGMGVSSALAGPDLLGTMLDRHGDNVEHALAQWEAALRPYTDFYQALGRRQRPFFTPNNRAQLTVRKGMTLLRQSTTAETALRRIPYFNRAARLKDHDIAGLPIHPGASALNC